MLVGKHGLTGLRPVADIYASLDELSDDTVEAFRDAIHERPSDGFAELLVGLLNQRSSDMEARYALTVNKLVEHRDENGGYDLGFLSLRVYKQVMSGLRSYRGFGYRMPQDILNQEDPNAVATAGLIRLTTRMLDDPEGCGITEEKQSHGVKLDSTDLVKMVLERPEDADRIADAVAERQSTDATVIRDMLDSPSQSLRDGVL